MPRDRKERPLSDPLSSRHCVPCRGGVPPLAGDDLRALHAELDGGWQVVEAHHLHKVFSFGDFRTALDFTNRVGELAEAEGHHPDIRLSWGRVEIEIFTHKIDGLTESDFILAARIDRL
jgi:4a-hydroxytetrahydrobiopterin dehydratase